MIRHHSAGMIARQAPPAGEAFFATVTATPVPADLRALRALKRSSFALDLYGWLCHESYRAHSTGKGRFVSWGALAEPLGVESLATHRCTSRARALLPKIAAVAPAPGLAILPDGLAIAPAPAAHRERRPGP